MELDRDSELDCVVVYRLTGNDTPPGRANQTVFNRKQLQT
jgi:hypothetical protein